MSSERVTYACVVLPRHRNLLVRLHGARLRPSSEVVLRRRLHRSVPVHALRTVCRSRPRPFVRLAKPAGSSRCKVRVIPSLYVVSLLTESSRLARSRDSSVGTVAPQRPKYACRWSNINIVRDGGLCTNSLLQ